MAKMGDRERLAELEARQRRAAEDVSQPRSALRTRYATAVAETIGMRTALQQFSIQPIDRKPIMLPQKALPTIDYPFADQ